MSIIETRIARRISTVRQGPFPPELKKLIFEHPDLLSRSGKLYGDICSASPNNMIGACLAQKYMPTIATMLRAHQLPLPDTFKTPVVHIPEVPLFFIQHDLLSENGPKEEWIESNIITGPVMYKIICGKKVGLMYDGPYAGLLLRDHSGCKNPAEGMRAVRLFNNELFTLHSLPYHLKFIPTTDDFFLFKEELDAFIENEYCKLALRVAGINTESMNAIEVTQMAAEKTEGKVWLADMLSVAASEIGYPINPNTLNMTLPLSFTQ